MILAMYLPIFSSEIISGAMTITIELIPEPHSPHSNTEDDSVNENSIKKLIHILIRIQRSSS